MSVVSAVPAAASDACPVNCMWHWVDESGRRIHIAAPEIFPRLRGVTVDRLDEVMAGFSDDDWTWLEQGFLDFMYGYAHALLADTLGFDLGDSDALDVFSRINQTWISTQFPGGTK